MAKHYLPSADCARTTGSPGPAARMALGEIYLLRKRRPEALQQYRAVTDVAPQHPMALNNLAWLLATLPQADARKPQEAVALAERLCEMTSYSEPLSLDTLSVALAANEQFERAIEHLEKAIVLAERSGISTERMQSRLRLFRAGKPYVEQ